MTCMQYRCRYCDAWFGREALEQMDGWRMVCPICHQSDGLTMQEKERIFKDIGGNRYEIRKGIGYDEG